MNKKLLYIGITLLIVGMMIAPVSAIVTPPTTFKDIFFKGIWTAIMDLQKQITNIKTTPGPTGPTGAQGPTGKDGATVHFGEYSHNYELNKIYTATTDGYVVGSAWNNYPLKVELYGEIWTSGLSYPILSITLPPSQGSSFTIPVQAGHDWAINTGEHEDIPTQISWIPLTP